MYAGPGWLGQRLLADAQIPADDLSAMNTDEFDQAFVGLLTEHQPDIHLYIRSLLPQPDAAADALQETNTVLWAKRQEFDLESNFCAWAFAIARFKVLAIRRDSARHAVLFSETLMRQIADQSDQHDGPFQVRQQALRDCLQRLPHNDRELITLRYQPGVTVESISTRFNRSMGAVYKALTRIRRALLVCIEHRLALEEHP
jgi:RNA polymerase sigma-70 factor, ECF subfamily